MKRAILLSRVLADVTARNKGEPLGATLRRMFVVPPILIGLIFATTLLLDEKGKTGSSFCNVSEAEHALKSTP
jgi:hypothetical protein